MAVRVLVKNLQDGKVMRGSVSTNIQLGKPLHVHLDATTYLHITSIKGWVQSDSLNIIYLIDEQGLRFKLRSI